MNDLIRRGDAIKAVTDADRDCRGAHGARENIAAIPAHPVQEPPSPGVTAGATGGRCKVPEGQTPLDDNLGHRLLDVIKEGQAARDSGTGSPYHGHSLEHCLHATGWVQRDLRLALDAAEGAAPPAPVVPAEGLDALHWCDGCRAVGAMHCAYPDECGQLVRITAAELVKRLDSWKAWLDDLPLPEDFQEGAEDLQSFITQLAALRSAPPVGARVTDWQPIETAPKDGVTEVLMYDPDLGMAVWPSANSPWPNVTHWQPLPEPPAALLPAGEGEE